MERIHVGYDPQGTRLSQTEDFPGQPVEGFDFFPFQENLPAVLSPDSFDG